MGNKNSSLTLDTLPKNSPVRLMLETHGPEASKWMEHWHHETSRLSLPTWPVLGSLLPEKLSAIRIFLMESPQRPGQLVNQWTAYALWLGQSAQHRSPRALKAQRKLERKLEEKIWEQRESCNGYGRLPSGPPAINFLPHVPTPIIPTRSQALSLWRLGHHLVREDHSRVQSGATNSRVSLENYSQVTGDLKIARVFIARLLFRPEATERDVMEYLVGSDHPGNEDEVGEDSFVNILAPLRAVAAPADYSLSEIHQPWSPSEIMNLKAQFPVLRTNPKEFLTHLNDVLHTYKPTLPDLRQLLGVLLTTDQLTTVMQKAGWTAEMDPRDIPAKTENNQPIAENPLLSNKIQEILTAIQGLCPRRQDMDKIKNCRQGKGEDVGDYLDRLKSMYVQYSGMDDPVNKARYLIIAQFVEGLHPKASADIKRICVGWDSLPYEQILAQARHYCNIYERKLEEVQERLMSLQITTLEQHTESNSAALAATAGVGKRTLQMVHQPPNADYCVPPRGPSNGDHQTPQRNSNVSIPQPAPLPNQCRYCKELGHWIADCPVRPHRPLKYLTPT